MSKNRRERKLPHVVVEDITAGEYRDVAAFANDATAQKFAELYRSDAIPGREPGSTVIVVDFAASGLGQYLWRMFSRPKRARIMAALQQKQKEGANG